MNRKIELIKNQSFKQINNFGIVVSFIFLALLTLSSMSLDLHKNNGNITLFTPVLDLFIILLLPIFLFPLFNLLVLSILEFYDDVPNKKILSFCRFLNILSIASFILFLILVSLQIVNIFNQWIDVGAIIETDAKIF
ncbi:hypothetical protein HYX15_01740 [Candidatus Woesearchaeota archaeon]|nr:hypothetical protein [Candidatus Woesearchaeota archaeon]